MIVSASFFLIILALLVLVRLGSFDRILIAEFSRRLEAASGLKLDAEKITVDPFNLSVGLKKPVFRATGEPGPVLREFSADNVFLDVPRSLVFGGRLRFQRVHIVRPVAAMAPTSPSGRSEVDMASSGADLTNAGGSVPAQESGGLDLKVEILDVEEGRLSWNGGAESFSLSLSDIGIRVRYDPLRRNHIASLAASGGQLKYSNDALEFGRLEIKGRLSAEDIDVETFVIETGTSSLNLQGSVEDALTSPSYSAKGRLSLSTKEIPVPPLSVYDVEGTLAVEFAFSGENGTLTYEADVSSNGLRIREFEITNLLGKVQGDSTSLSITGLDIRSNTGRVTGKLSANRNGQNFSGIDLEWHDLDPDRILALFPSFTKSPVSVGSLMNGRLRGNAESLSLRDIEGSAVLELVPKPLDGNVPSQSPNSSSAEVPAPPRPPAIRPAGEIALHASGGEIVLDEARLSAAGISLILSAKLRREGSIDGRYAIGIGSVGETFESLRLMGDIVPPSSGSSIGPENLSGSVSLEGSISGRPEAPAFTGFLEIPELDFRGLQASTLRASFKGGLGNLALNDLSAMFAGGTVLGSGVLPFDRDWDSGAPVMGMNTVPVDRFTLEFEDIHLEQIAPLFFPPGGKETKGLFSGRVEITAPPEGPAAIFSGQMTSLLVSGIEFPRLELKANYADSRLEIVDFLAETRGGSITGGGGFDIGRKTFFAKLSSDAIDLGHFRPLLPPDADIGGRASLRIDAEGGISDPRGTVTLQVKDLHLGPASVPSLEIEARSDGAMAEASLRIPDYNLLFEGKLALDPPLILRGNLFAESFPLDRLFQIASAPAEQEFPAPALQPKPGFDLDAAFIYPLADPSSFSAEIAFSGKDLSLDSAGASSGPPPTSLFTVSGEGRIHAAGDPTAATTMKIEGEVSRLLMLLGDVTLKNQEAVRFRFDEGVLRLDSMILTGPGGSFAVSGTAGPFSGTPSIDGRIRSDIDIKALSPFASGMLIGGRLKSDIGVRGEISAPSLTGRAVVEDAFVRADDFPLILSGITAVLSFDGSRATLERLDGTANGGPISVKGGLEGLPSPVPPSGRFVIEAKNFQLNYPPGLRTTSDLALALTGDGKEWALTGNMKILRGLFREDISPGGQILGFGSYRWVRSETELPSFIRNIRLDIAVDTVEPIVFKNNLANVEILADLRVSGNPGLPLFSGRMRNAAVGEIVFSERRFVLEKAQIDLLGQRIPNPNLDIVAHTQITHNLESLDVRLQLSGSTSDLRYSLSSTPPRSKEDLSLILLTGRSLDEVKGNAINTLTAQTIQFFSSPIASPVTRTLERVLKAEDISVEPLIISAEADPGARFTFRKRISEGVAVTYSADITSTHSQTWILDYRLKKNFLLQAFRKDNGSYGGSLRHAIPIGAKPPLSTASLPGTPGGRTVLDQVILEGDPKLPLSELNSALRRIREGKPFSYALLTNALDRLLKAYKKRDYLNADIRPTVTKSEDGTKLDVRLVFTPGDPVGIVYKGDSVSRPARRAIRKNWTGLLPEDINLEEARSLLLEKLHRKGHYEANVKTETSLEAGEKFYEITIEKGPRYHIRRFQVVGNGALTTDRIRKAAGKYPLAKYKGLWNLVYDPQTALDAILNVYRQAGFSETSIQRPQITGNPETKVVDLLLMVGEGPRRMIHDIRFEGNALIADADLRSVLESSQGKPFDQVLLRKDRDSLLAFCRSRGLREAEVDIGIVPRTDGPDFDVIFKISEGPVHTVSNLQVTGVRRTRPNLVLKTAKIKKGDVFSFESLAAGQKRLYDIGAFRAVNISTPPPDEESSEVPLVIDVREEPPLTFTYGLRYNSEDKLEGQVELAMVNLLGGGRTGYASYRKSSRLWDARFSLKLPYLLGIRADTRFSLSASRESREAYISDEIAGTLRQETRFPNDFSLSLFYRLSRVREKEPDAANFGPRVVLSELSLNLIRDTRDDRFDPRAGTFLSLSLTAAPKVFGSELTYVKVFAQYSFYKNIGGGNIIWASNVRLGLTTAFKQELLASLLFYAGGGTSIRGFEQDRVGPINPESGLPAGGKVLFLVNQELRIPLFFWFSGVIFYDVGNVYPSFRDMTRFALRQGIGAGLRSESPVGLIRFDCGFNPFRRPGEPPVVLFLSLGQSF